MRCPALLLKAPQPGSVAPVAARSRSVEEPGGFLLRTARRANFAKNAKTGAKAVMAKHRRIAPSGAIFHIVMKSKYHRA